MSDATPIHDALAGLDDLAACDLRLAKRFCAHIESLPEDEDAKAMDLARSYQRMARSYRQTIVVQARLRRELKAEARHDGIDIQAAERRKVRAMQDVIRAVMRPYIWTPEREHEQAENLDARFEDLLDYAAGRREFLDVPPEGHLIAMLDALGVEPPPEADAPSPEGQADSTPHGAPAPSNGHGVPRGDPPLRPDDSS